MPGLDREGLVSVSVSGARENSAHPQNNLPERRISLDKGMRARCFFDGQGNLDNRMQLTGRK